MSIATIVASGFTWPPDLDPSVAHCLRYDDSGALLVDLSLDAAKNALASMERSSLTWSSFSAGHSWEAYFEPEEAREDAARRRAQVQTLAATLKKIQAIAAPSTPAGSTPLLSGNPRSKAPARSRGRRGRRE